MLKQSPIGLFDSGVGGLTVFAALREALPQEALFYLGDTARLPYGTKSKEVVKQYALNCARFLVQRQAKLLVVACNTASAYAIPAIQSTFPVPVVGVVEPGAHLAATATRNGKIGVIGTEGTIHSHAYQKAVQSESPEVKIWTQACPLFVPLAEEGMIDHQATLLMIAEYLNPLKDRGIDTLILGCTHYPILKKGIQTFMGQDVRVIDSAMAVAHAVVDILTEQDLLAPSAYGDEQFFVTDVSARVKRIGSAFLGRPLSSVSLVQL